MKLVEKPVYSEDFALLYGILLGDGCLSKFGRNARAIIISCSLKDDIPFFEEIVIPILKNIKNKTYKYHAKPKQGSIEIKIYDKPFFVEIKRLGFPIGHKGPFLKISEIFDDTLYKHIVQGYFATDGCLVVTNNNGTLYPRIEFCSISKTLLIQVLEYLTKIGMKGKLYNCSRSGRVCFGKYIRKDSYRIQFNGRKNLRTFVKEIGLVNPKHKEKYLRWEKSAGTEI